MPKLSVKENYMRTLRGDTPEYIPGPGDTVRMPRPPLFYGDRNGKTGIDFFGVEWSKEGSALDAPIPRHDYFILDDIRKWRDVIKFPDISWIDWESMAKKDKEKFNPELPFGAGCAAGGMFQNFISFMGFTEGLIAVFEEPEEVRALAEALCDYYLAMADDFLKYYEPDYIYFTDDIAAERSPFISLESFHEIFEPVWRRYISYYKERGYLAAHHNCGCFEPFLDDLVDMGFNCWDPAQVCNDLVGIKKKFGNKLVINGGFPGNDFLPHLEATEEQCRAAVKDTLDKLAPGGGFVFSGGAGGGPGVTNPVSQQRSQWIRDEFEKLRYSYY